MNTYQKMIGEAVDSHPAMPEEARFGVRGNTRTVVVWHLQDSPTKKSGMMFPSRVQIHPSNHQAADAKRQATLEAEEATEERAKFEQLRALYQFSSSEWEDSEKNWRAFLASRSTKDAEAVDFVSSWREEVAAPKPKEGETVGEACFSKVNATHHDKCMLCEAFNAIWADPTLSSEEKKRNARRLAHRNPKRLISAPTRELVAPGAREEATFDALKSASAWGHESSSSTGKRATNSNERLFGSMSGEASSIVSAPDVRKGQYKLSQTITKSLVKRAGLLSDKQIVRDLTTNKKLRKHSEAVLHRVGVYRANMQAAESALVTADQNKSLSLADIEKASKAKADALELERDLAMLDVRLQATKAGIEFAKKGHSVLKYNDMFCEIRRLQKATGYYHRQRGGHGDDDSHAEWYSDDDEGEKDEEEELGEEQEVGSDVAKGSTSERIGRPQREQNHDLLLKLARAGKRTASKEPPSPHTLTESPEEQIEGFSRYFKAMPEVGGHSHYQEGNASVSAHDGPFALEMALTAVTSISKRDGPSTEVATAFSSSRHAKKDSKVDMSLEEDGVNLQDFAVRPEQKKGKGPQKRPVKADSPARLRWR